MLTPDDLRGIADELRALAGDLYCGHTLSGEWHDDDARREHDKLLAWADAISNHPERDLEMVGLQCLADIRAAVGDSGQMMQPELVECVKRLREDAERYRWLRDIAHGAAGGAPVVFVTGPDNLPRTGFSDIPTGAELDRAVDAARAKES